MVKISFAWDDGPVEDLRMIDMCMKYQIPAIFFIPVKNSERAVISKSDVKAIYRHGFEIGAHTYSHSYLTSLSLSDSEKELATGKEYYEQLLGKEIVHFCYPGGQYNDKLSEIANKYFETARTADTGAIIIENSFLVKPTFHFYDRGKVSLIYNSFKNSPLINYLTIRNAFARGYFNFLRNIIFDLNDYPKTHRIIIWGHSWEIEQYSLWSELEDLFQWVNLNFQGQLLNYSDLLNFNSFKER